MDEAVPTLFPWAKSEGPAEPGERRHTIRDLVTIMEYGGCRPRLENVDISNEVREGLSRLITKEVGLTRAFPVATSTPPLKRIIEATKRRRGSMWPSAERLSEMMAISAGMSSRPRARASAPHVCGRTEPGVWIASRIVPEIAVVPPEATIEPTLKRKGDQN